MSASGNFCRSADPGEQHAGGAATDEGTRLFERAADRGSSDRDRGVGGRTFAMFHGTSWRSWQNMHTGYGGGARHAILGPFFLFFSSFFSLAGWFSFMPGWLPYLICWGVFATDPGRLGLLGDMYQFTLP